MHKFEPMLKLLDQCSRL